MSETDQLMTLDDVAEYLKVAKATLYSWRCKNENTGPETGPRAIKIGRHVRYRPADVEAWLEKRRQMPETDEWDRQSCPHCRDTGKVRSEEWGTLAWPWHHVCDRCAIQWESELPIDARPHYV